MAQDQAAPKEKGGGAFYLFVLISIALGAALGALDPTLAQNEWIKALGDDFVKLIKMIIAPVIFCTVASGIGNAHGGGKVGRVGLTALVYFEILSTFALGLGLVVGELAHPGAGFSGVKPNASAVTQYLDQAHHMSPVDFVSNIIPDTLFGAFAKGDILQVLFCAILFGFALMGLGERGAPLRTFVDEASAAFFGIVKIIMRAAPFGAFGAMAYTVGKFGVAALISLGALVACFYLTALLFVLIVLGAVAALAGFNIFKFLAYIREELLIILGTSSSESALPGLMQKLEKAGCARQVVGLVVPTGYSFNLDGTNIYMTLASVFIAQAMGVSLTMTQELTILGVAMLTSKGASGVTGAGFITLASTLAAVNPALLPGMAIVLGVDKFMSECRALTNVCGNGVATIVISRLEKSLDRTMLKQALG